MHTRHIPFIALLSVLFLQACSSSSGGNSPPPTVPPPPPPPPPPPAAAEWTLTWSDEFDSGISAAKWGFEVNCSGGGNNERQCYTSRPENAHVQDGILHIVAREELAHGPALQDDDPNYDPADTSATRQYTSARLRTRGLFDFRYGRVAIRARLPGGQGSWPALWMLPTGQFYGGWPLSGEIDIMEAVNLDTAAANAVHGTLHYGMQWPQWSAHGADYVNTLDLTGGFHVYALEWEADEIRWFVDGVHYQTQQSSGWYNYLWQSQDTGFGAPNARAPYDQPFHLLMNLAVGGDFPGNPDTGWTADRELQVDYVRVYKCNATNDTGSGCASRTDAVNPALAVNADSDGPQENAFTLFDGVPQPFALNFQGNAFNAPLVANFWELQVGNVVSTMPDAGGTHGPVWDINFTGLGNVFLTVGDLSAHGVENAVALTGGAGWTTHGELSFDLYVQQADPGTGLVVKLDSGYPNLGQLPIDLPAAGQWTRVHVRLSDLLDNPLAGGSGLSLGNLRNAFVLETTGTHSIHVQLDNIRLQCAVNPTALSWQTDRTCGISPVATPVAPFLLNADIYRDGVNTSLWDLGYQEFSTGADHITQTEVDLGGGHSALDLAFNSNGSDGVAWIGASSARNLGGFAQDGRLVLDVNVLDWGASTSPLMIKVECGAGCSTGDYPIGAQAQLGTNTWNTISIPVPTLLAHPGSNLTMDAVNNALVFFPAWGDSQGVHFQLRDARFELDQLRVFDEAISHWDFGVCCGGVAVEILADPVDAAGHGNVVEFRYSTDTTVTYFQSTAPLDLSAWAGGHVQFDLYIEAQPAGAAWMMKTDCQFPCGTGDVPLTTNVLGAVPAVGVWQHYSFAISDLVARGLQLSHVDTPLVIFPAWGNQNGAVFRVDNIRLTKN